MDPISSHKAREPTAETNSKPYKPKTHIIIDIDCFHKMSGGLLRMKNILHCLLSVCLLMGLAAC
ncbi:MAG: hypothetical protein IK105_07975 [Thermoguttaceae bacterium]|nr:hypothetical protein [Thermoguttaceae bacterium]